MSYLKYIISIAIIGLVFACSTSPEKIPVTKKATPSGTQEVESKKEEYSTNNVPWSEINSLGKIPYDYLVPYGEAELQIGELRTPEVLDTFPLVIFLHGGCWLSEYNLDHVSAVCADLVKEGFAVWTPEYRRVGDEGGGYPGTFKDIQESINFARTLADIYPLDLENVILMGHSAGGHLALWMATQQQLPKSSRLYNKHPLPLKGVIALAGISDLKAYDRVENDCSSAVTQLMGGKAADLDSRYYKSSPINLLPTKIPIRLVHGELDNIVPLDQSIAFAKKAKGDVKILTIQGAGHFDMVSPYSDAWQTVKTELKAMID